MASMMAASLSDPDDVIGTATDRAREAQDKGRILVLKRSGRIAPTLALLLQLRDS